MAIFCKETPYFGLARTSCFFAAALKQLQRPIVSWLCARTAKERTFSHFDHDLVQSVCALHKHEAFALSHLLRPFSSGNLGVSRRIYNYRLTRARRMLEWVFGIVCNKWTIFHCAIDVCPDFCNVIVKTCCILHNFVRQRDGFQCQDILYECPLESIKAVDNRVLETGISIGAPLGNLEGGSYTRDFERWVKGTLGVELL